MDTPKGLHKIVPKEAPKMNRFKRWWLRRVRIVEFGRFYFRLTPNWGLGLPWFGGKRIRIAWHHGVQIVEWMTDRWYIRRQVLGRNKVTGGLNLELWKKEQ